MGCRHVYAVPRSAPKQTLARIEFLRWGGALVDKMGSFCVKILAEKRTKWAGK